MQGCCAADWGELAARRFRVHSRQALWALLGMIVALAPAANAFSQTALQAALESPGQVSPEKRAELYRQLHSQAEFLEKQSSVLKLVARLIGPTVVHVRADISQRSALQIGSSRHVEESGSGVIVEMKGQHYVLTSRHVISGAQPASINLKLCDGRILHPDKLWEDHETDIAVLAVSAPELVAAPLGNSDQLEIGDFVLAVGSPFGLSHSVTFGIISAKGRRDLELGDPAVKLQDFLQTDAAINPGNSGGPLVNLRGEVIGINTAIASNSGGSEGIGFAVPINMFIRFTRQLVEHGKVSRAFLGVTLDSSFGPAMASEIGLPRPVGARVIKIAENSPAALARLQEGDVILQFDNVSVESDAHLVNLVSLTDIGKQSSLAVYRGGKVIAVQVTVGDRSKF
jgi:serine protease Do